MGQTRSKLHKILSFLTAQKQNKNKTKTKTKTRTKPKKKKKNDFFYNHSWQRVNEMLEDVSVA